jgi:hypothetical protein
MVVSPSIVVSYTTLGYIAQEISLATGEGDAS